MLVSPRSSEYDTGSPGKFPSKRTLRARGDDAEGSRRPAAESVSPAAPFQMKGGCTPGNTPGRLKCSGRERDARGPPKVMQTHGGADLLVRGRPPGRPSRRVFRGAG